MTFKCLKFKNIKLFSALSFHFERFRARVHAQLLQFCLTLQPHGLQLTRLLRPWDSPGKNTGVGSHSLLQGIFPTQRSNLGLLNCKHILYHLSHQESPIYIHIYMNRQTEEWKGYSTHQDWQNNKKMRQANSFWAIVYSFFSTNILLNPCYVPNYALGLKQ